MTKFRYTPVYSVGQPKSGPRLARSIFYLFTVRQTCPEIILFFRNQLHATLHSLYALPETMQVNTCKSVGWSPTWQRFTHTALDQIKEAVSA